MDWEALGALSPVPVPVPRLAVAVTGREAAVTAATGALGGLSARLHRAGRQLRVLRGEGTWGHGDTGLGTWGQPEGDRDMGTGTWGRDRDMGWGHGDKKEGTRTWAGDKDRDMGTTRRGQGHGVGTRMWVEDKDGDNQKGTRTRLGTQMGTQGHGDTRTGWGRGRDGPVWLQCHRHPPRVAVTLRAASVTLSLVPRAGGPAGGPGPAAVAAGAGG